jgi:hypothetical protein
MYLVLFYHLQFEFYHMNYSNNARTYHRIRIVQRDIHCIRELMECTLHFSKLNFATAFSKWQHLTNGFHFSSNLLKLMTSLRYFFIANVGIKIDVYKVKMKVYL